MAQEKFKRKLTTIFSADVAGYSRLMGEDEAATVRTLEQYKEIMSELIRQHRGRVVDSPGDNLLAEFTSVVDGVQCAVAAQNEFKARNADLPESRKMQFRIGINLGDVIEEESRIYGDGVNIAARLESLADPGGICISKTAFDQIETKLPFGYAYLGEQTVKNIVKPVGAYRVLMEPRVMVERVKAKIFPVPLWRRKKILAGALVVLALFIGAGVWNFYFRLPSIEPVSKEKMAFPLPFPDKPSIAVLPFNNMSDDPQQEYFSDGISEDIITDLSKISGLIVIARNSSFTYKGKPVNVQQIGQDLGVRYLLEGSVRKVGDQVRLNAQLIDSSNGQHLWAERYDGKIDDVFALQDKITRKIISALALKLTTNEEKAVVDKGTDNLLAYDEFLKGWQSYRQLNNEGFARAKVHLEKAVELDPEFSRAYASLAILYWRAGQYAGLQQGLGLIDVNSMQVATVKSHLLLKKAMKKPTALAYGMMSQIYLYRFLHNKALAAIEQAIAMDPNDPDLYAWMSNILWFMGENSRAIESAQRAQRLDPNNPALYLFHLGSAYAPDGDLQESLALLEKSRRLNPEFGAPTLRQSVIYALQGRIEEARATLQIFIMRRATGAPLNLKVFMAAFPFADPKTSDRIAEALVKAGVPAKPADYCRLSKENLLNGHEIKSLLFGHRITGISLLKGGDQFWYEWAKDGEFQFTRGAYQYGGKYWVEEEVLFTQSDNLYAGLPYGSTIFRNPGGTKEDKNEYFILTDLAFMLSFSIDE